MDCKAKILIAYNQPSEGGFSNYDGREKSVKDKRKKVDLSEEGVIEEFEDIRKTLNSLGYQTKNLNVCKDFINLVDFIKKFEPDVVFNLVESIDGESIKEVYIAGLYELMHVSFTGNEPMTLGLCLNKHQSKLLLRSYKIKTPGWRLYNTPETLSYDSGVKFPLIVKLSREDASVGISEHSVVYDEAQLTKRLNFMYESFRQPLIAEEYIKGREINSAILGDKNKIALPLSEIDFSTLPKDLPNIVTYDGKWIKDSIYYNATVPVCPAPIEAKKAEEIKKLSIKIAEIFNLRDYARVDYRLAEDGTPFVIEVNPNPDISHDAGFPRAAKAYGLEYNNMIEEIIKYALERKC